MKKILLILILLAIGMGEVFSQSNTTPFQVPDSTTSFGQNLPNGRIVFNLQDNKLWRLTTSVTGVKTLATATKTLVVASADINLSNYIQATGGNNVMGQNLNMNSNRISVKNSGITTYIAHNDFYGGLSLKDSATNKQILYIDKTGLMRIRHSTADHTFQISTGGLSGYAFLTTSKDTMNIYKKIKFEDISSATTPSTLYYNTTTKEVSYGAAPTGGATSIPIDSVINLQDSLTSKANVTDVATKWTQGGDSIGSGSSDIGTLDDRSVAVVVGGHKFMKIDSITNYVNQISEGSNSIYNRYTNETLGAAGGFYFSSSGGDFTMSYSSTSTNKRWFFGNSGFITMYQGRLLVGAASNPFYDYAIFGDKAGSMGLQRSSTAVDGFGHNLWQGGCGTAKADGEGGTSYINAPISTGKGKSQYWLNSMSRSTTSGTTANTQLPRIGVMSTKQLTDNTNDTLFSFTLNADSSFTCQIRYGVYAKSSTQWQNENGSIWISVVKESGVITTVGFTDIDNQFRQAISSGTLTGSTPTLSLSGSTIYVIVKWDSSLNPTAGNMRMEWLFENYSQITTFTQY